MPPPETGPDRNPTTSGGRVPAWMALSALGLEMAVTVLVLGAAGWGLDRWLGSTPWGLLVGLLLGSVIGLLNLVRGAVRAMDTEQGSGRPSRRGRS